jgi:hypothetical protein
MIEFMPESTGGVLGVRASGLLTASDYYDVFVPRLEREIAAHGKLRILFYMDEAFRGWDAGAAWANTKLDFAHARDFDKIAMIGAPRWEEFCIGLASHLMKGEMRTFPPEQIAQAWEWVKR